LFCLGWCCMTHCKLAMLRSRHRQALAGQQAWYKEKVDECVSLRQQVSESKREIEVLRAIIKEAHKVMNSEVTNGN
jgi:uncharacterized protein YecT (DUF1311 family)